MPLDPKPQQATPSEESVLHDFTLTSFGGVPMAQHWIDLIVWESILNMHPEIESLVELGTWTGGMALYLHAQCSARGIDFFTMDVRYPHEQGVPGIPNIPGFGLCDIFREADNVRAMLGDIRAPILLFCDNGNKPREVREFAHVLPEGSIIAVHDWGTEIGPADIPDVWKPLHADYVEALGGITRWFAR